MDSDYFTDDRDALLTQLQEELDGIINPGCDEITSGFAVSLAEKYDFMYAAVGWHPEDLEGILDNSYLDELAAWAVHPKVVASARSASTITGRATSRRTCRSAVF